MAGEFLLRDTFALIRKVGDAQRALIAFWQHPKSNNLYDPEIVVLMHTTLAKISEWFGVQPTRKP